MHLTRPISIALGNYISKSNTWTVSLFEKGKDLLENVKWAVSLQMIADFEAISVI